MRIVAVSVVVVVGGVAVSVVAVSVVDIFDVCVVAVAVYYVNVVTGVTFINTVVVTLCLYIFVGVFTTHEHTRVGKSCSWRPPATVRRICSYHQPMYTHTYHHTPPHPFSDMTYYSHTTNCYWCYR